VAHLGQPVDRHLLRHPSGRLQLRAWGQRPVGDQREQHPLDGGVDPAARGHLGDRLADPQPGPQLVEHPGAAQVPAVDYAHVVVGERRGLVGGVEDSGDRAHQPG